MLIQKSEEEEINSALEIAYSRGVKEAVIEKLGRDQILSGKLKSPETSVAAGGQASGFFPGFVTNSLSNAKASLNELLFKIGVRDPITDQERALNELDGLVHIYAPKKSRVISIYSEANNPEMAQAIVNAVADAYVEEHIEISQTEGSLEFFENEATETARKLEAAKLEMTKFMSERQLVSVDSNRELVKNAWDEILADILRLESEDRRMAAMLSKRHPRRVAVMEQLASARNALNRVKQTGVIDSTSAGGLGNPEKDGSGKSNRSSILLESIKSRNDSNMVSKIESLIMSSNELEIYQDRVQTLETQLSLVRRKRQEARLIKEQKLRSISNINIFQSGTLNQKPIAPNKPLVVVGTMFFGMCLAIAFSVCREVTFRQKRLYDTTDVERTLKLPVVAKLPVDRSGAQKKLKSKDSLRVLRNECSDIVHRFVQVSHEQQANKKGVVVGVLSFDAGNGGSTVAAALATSCSEDFGIRTLLVDADRKNRSVSQRFSLNGSPGLCELVKDGIEIKTSYQRSSLFDLTLVSSTNKSRTGSMSEVVSVSEVLEQLADLSGEFEIVVVDMPPATSSDSLAAMAPLMDYVLLVAESGRTKFKNASEVLRKFENSDSEVLGVVLNKFLHEFPWQRTSFRRG